MIIHRYKKLLRTLGITAIMLAASHTLVIAADADMSATVVQDANVTATSDTTTPAVLGADNDTAAPLMATAANPALPQQFSKKQLKAVKKQILSNLPVYVSADNSLTSQLTREQASSPNGVTLNTLAEISALTDAGARRLALFKYQASVQGTQPSADDQATFKKLVATEISNLQAAMQQNQMARRQLKELLGTMLQSKNPLVSDVEIEQIIAGNLNPQGKKMRHKKAVAGKTAANKKTAHKNKKHKNKNAKQVTESTTASADTATDTAASS